MPGVGEKKEVIRPGALPSRPEPFQPCGASGWQPFPRGCNSCVSCSFDFPPSSVVNACEGKFQFRLKLNKPKFRDSS